MIIKPIKTRIFRPGENLLDFVRHYFKKVPERSIVVVTSKIVALAENRVVDCRTVHDRVRLIKSESRWAVKTRYTWLTIKDGAVMASAGIDQSNANGRSILLPRDSFRRAGMIRRQLMNRFRVRRLGVLITDSRLMPLRQGVIGLAVGYAGFRGLRDYRGMKDLFGRRLRMTRTNVADGLATAAVLTMGEGAERQPLAVIEGAPVVFTNRQPRHELLIDPREDIYRPLFQKISGLRIASFYRQRQR